MIVAPNEDLKLLGLFQDIHCEELNFPTLFFGQLCSNQGTKMSYQTIAQWELLHKNHDFATHTPNLFFEIIKVLIHCSIIIFDSNMQSKTSWMSTSST
jgi:hypothetical protein